MSDIYENLLTYNYRKLLSEALQAAGNDVDKREGSVIYDALAPLCMAMAKSMSTLYEISRQSRFQTATEEYLESAGSQLGVYRLQATGSLWEMELKPSSIALAVGDKVTSASGLGLVYTVETINSSTSYDIRCDTLGSIGGRDFGPLVTVNNVNGITSLEFKTRISGGSDKELDEDYRLRIWSRLNENTYGGNFIDYKRWVLVDFPQSVGGCVIDGFQIYNPSGGNVSLFIVGDNVDPSNNIRRFMPLVAYCRVALKTYLDPVNASGYGGGIVPTGHRIDVGFIDMGNSPISMSASITAKPGSVVDEDMKQNILQAFLELFNKIREDAFTTIGSDYPFDGYSCFFSNSAFIASAMQSDSRLNTISLVNDCYGAFVDMTFMSTGEPSIPWLLSLSFDGVPYYSGE